MKKKLLLAICLMVSLAGYGQTTKTVEGTKVTITNLVAGHLADYLSDEERFTGTHMETIVDGEYTWNETVPDDPLVETLVVSGEINGDDIKIMADMCRWNWYDRHTGVMTYPKRGQLKHLDISDCKIVAGGGHYFEATAYTRPEGTSEDLSGIAAWGLNAYFPHSLEGTTTTRDTENDVVGDYMFFGCDVLETIKLPNTIKEIGESVFTCTWVLDEIVIPASVNKIGARAFKQAYNSEKVDRYSITRDPEDLPFTTVRLSKPLEDMDNVVELGEDALKLSDPFMIMGGVMFTPLVHLYSPVYQLDDFAYNPQLQESYEKGHVKGVATPPNKYWTFSCGVDVYIPDNVKVYTCQIINGEADINELTDELVDDTGKRMIKRNNGVLVACPDNADSNAYELVAKYNADLVGTEPATESRNDYPNNSLVAVVKKAHYTPGDYYMLYHGKWVVLASDAEQVPAGKALLKK